jgi:hypothetical protein
MTTIARKLDDRRRLHSGAVFHVAPRIALGAMTPDDTDRSLALLPAPQNWCNFSPITAKQAQGPGSASLLFLALLGNTARTESCLPAPSVATTAPLASSRIMKISASMVNDRLR